MSYKDCRDYRDKDWYPGLTRQFRTSYSDFSVIFTEDLSQSKIIDNPVVLVTQKII